MPLDDLTRRRLKREGWPRGSIEAFEAIGTRTSLLYGITRRDEPTTLPEEKRSGRVRWVDAEGKTRRGVLIQAVGPEARVLDDREARRAARAKPAKLGRKDFPGEGRAPATTYVPVGAIYPEGAA